MQNSNRRIEDFKNLSQTTVWKRLDAMADNYAVYSTHLKGLAPFLTDFDVYIYCNDTNLVILCLDCCGHDEKYIYEECDSLDSIIFTQDEEPRSSGVWKLAETVSMAKLVTCSNQPAAEIQVHKGDGNRRFLFTTRLFPSGEIEQNLNLSVKVKILRPIPNPRRELEKLVGCEDIKRRMDELVALTQYNKMMQKSFPLSKQHEVSLHSVFLGRPGTGKTTVCKIFGSLLHQAGALSKGHVVMCDRGTFIGTLWGDEERSMNQVLEMAKGGVLMIDEAYLLNGKHETDPGKLVIQLLMNILADETQRDIAVVLCGYKEPMQKLLDSNPGLQSRFPNKFEFTDFSIEELLEITRRRVREYEYEFTPEAWDKYRDVLAEAYQQRDPQTWGNARFIGNLLDRIYIQHARRCVRHYPKDKHDLLMLTPDDIVSIETPRQRPKIGF